MNKRMIIACAMLVAGFVAFAQAGAEQIDKEALELGRIKELYAAAEYTACRAAIDNALLEYSNRTLNFSPLQVARIFVFRALVVYAFREEGYQREIESLLLKAIELDLNYDFEDYAVIPTFIIDRFVRLKKDYLARFSRSAKRHSLGIFGVVSYLPILVSNPDYIKTGVHYSFNLDDSLSVLLDFEIPLSGELFRVIQGRTGAIWFPSFKVETMSFGLGVLYSLRIDEWKSFTNVFSVEGYGEIILRSGLGFGAGVELLRLDWLMGDGTLETLGYVDLFSSDKLRFSFANLRLYVFYNF